MTGHAAEALQRVVIEVDSAAGIGALDDARDLGFDIEDAVMAGEVVGIAFGEV